MKGILPSLISLRDIKGDLQMHTTATDGKASIEEMAAKAKELGYEYIAITDHSQAVRVAHGLTGAQLARHISAIRKANTAIKGIRIFAGVEVDILEDGSLDLKDDVLKECDVVAAAVHSHFTMSENAMTKRILKALDNPCVNVLVHRQEG